MNLSCQEMRALPSDSTGSIHASRAVELRSLTGVRLRQAPRQRGRNGSGWGLLGTLALGMMCGIAQAQSLVTTIPCGPAPYGLAVNETTNTIYVADAPSDGTGATYNTVKVIDGATNTVTTTLEPGGPNTSAVAVNPTTNTIYALNGGSQVSTLTGLVITPGSVAVIDGATNTITATVALPALGSYIAVNPVTNQIYVGTISEIGNGAVSTVVAIDGSTNAITATISIPQLGQGIAVDTVRNVIYVLSGNYGTSSYLTAIDGTTNTLTTSITLGNASAFALNGTTNTIYVNDAKDNIIYVIDGATETIAATLPGPAAPITLGTQGIAVNPMTNLIYLPTYNTTSVAGAVQVMDGSTNTVIANIPVPGLGALLVNPVTNKVWQFSYPVLVLDGVTDTTTSVTGTPGTLEAWALNTVTNYAYVTAPNAIYVINGAATGPAFVASPSPLAFGNQTEGTPSSPMTLTVTNTGTTDLSITSVTPGGTNMADFSVESDACTGTTVAAGKTCTVSVEFEPNTTSGETATLTFTDNASDSPQTVNLTGTGVAPVATATTTTLTASAASVPVGTSVTLTATVTATSGTPTPTGTVTFKDGTATLGTGTLSGGMATWSGSSLVIGTHSITASYPGDSRNIASTSSAITVTVAAGATTTALTASADSIAVGSSVTFTATVMGTSGVPAPTGTVTFMNGATTLGSGTLSSGTATYSSSSLATGSYSVTATYGGDTNNAASTSSAVAVTVWPGTPNFSVSLSPSSGSVKAGTPATVTVTVTSTNGFASATNLSCTGLPKDATCTFSASSVTPAVAGTATSTLTIKTDTSTSAALDRFEIGPGSHPGRVAFAVVGGLFLLPILGSKRRKLRHLLQSLSLSLLFLILAAGALTGCGGGPKTPAGSYTIQVTATSGSITQQAAYSFTVQ